MGLGVKLGGFECFRGNLRVVVDQILEGVAALETTEHRVDGDACSVNDGVPLGYRDAT